VPSFRAWDDLFRKTWNASPILKRNHILLPLPMAPAVTKQPIVVAQGFLYIFPWLSGGQRGWRVCRHAEADAKLDGLRVSPKRGHHETRRMNKGLALAAARALRVTFCLRVLVILSAEAEALVRLFDLNIVACPSAAIPQ
jgi:hypothetical protein